VFERPIDNSNTLIPKLIPNNTLEHMPECKYPVNYHGKIWIDLIDKKQP
jgi:hypothetical protein